MLFVLCFGITAFAEPPREGYSLTFADEFDGKELNLENWHYRNEGVKTRGGYNDPAMVTVSDGNLHIGFEKSHGDYRGGGVITNFGLGYGYYEVRSKLFGGTGGLHSSFWTAGVNGDGITSPAFNSSIEIDIYEVDSNNTTNIAPNLHYWLGGHLAGPRKWVQTADGGYLFRNLTDAAKDYFVAGCEYLPDRIVWYLNGEKIGESRDAEMYGRPNLWLTALANTELSGEIDDKKLPGESVWDYFRFYTMPLKGENIIVNPSFDDNNRVNYTTDISKMRLDTPASWLEPKNSNNISVETEDAHIRTGTGALKIEKSGTVAQDLNYIANGTYQLSFYVQCEDFTKLTAKVNDEAFSFSTATGEDFAIINMEQVEITDNRAYISLSAEGKGDVYLDDVSFVCFDGTDEFNRKVPIDPCRTTKIPGEVALYDINSGSSDIEMSGNWLKSSIKGFTAQSAYANAQDSEVKWNLVATENAKYLLELYRMSYDNSNKEAKGAVYINGEQIKEFTLDLLNTEPGMENLGVYNLKKGDKVTVSLKRNGAGYLRADSARIVPAGAYSASQGLVLKLSENVAYANLSKRFIDPDNKSAVPYINDKDRTLIPLRFIAESIGATVSYVGTPGILGGTDEIKIELKGKTLLFATDIPQYAIDGEVLPLDAPPENKMARTYVPVRALAEAFGKNVYYSDGIILLTDSEIEDESVLTDLNQYLY